MGRIQKFIHWPDQIFFENFSGWWVMGRIQKFIHWPDQIFLRSDLKLWTVGLYILYARNITWCWLIQKSMTACCFFMEYPLFGWTNQFFFDWNQVVERKSENRTNILFKRSSNDPSHSKNAPDLAPSNLYMFKCTALVFPEFISIWKPLLRNMKLFPEKVVPSQRAIHWTHCRYVSFFSLKWDWLPHRSSCLYGLSWLKRKASD